MPSRLHNAAQRASHVTSCTLQRACLDCFELSKCVFANPCLLPTLPNPAQQTQLCWRAFRATERCSPSHRAFALVAYGLPVRHVMARGGQQGTLKGVRLPQCLSALGGALLD